MIIIYLTPRKVELNIENGTKHFHKLCQSLERDVLALESDKRIIPWKVVLGLVWLVHTKFTNNMLIFEKKN